MVQLFRRQNTTPVPTSGNSTPRGHSDMGLGVEQEQFQQDQGILSRTSVAYPLESDILNERSQQIRSLRSSVYGIQDLYVQIGDMVEYQGEQLEDIENNMYNVVGDSAATNLEFQTYRNRRGGMSCGKYLDGVYYFNILPICTCGIGKEDLMAILKELEFVKVLQLKK
ncbi:bifunctional SNARE/Target SNARE coiled-coil homology domain [Babesia duncani]|uniref:Bifunctional SNARE/Target SNARE coiled-coil homology domain n=1 Tax=Babesia duncani TaxID=323732 RepID=A0AAD9PIS8_9APIC|nr:bifunctional SNARE/Target SNARE coiled-coil homology domain [Babesia duncani]